MRRTRVPRYLASFGQEDTKDAVLFHGKVCADASRVFLLRITPCGERRCAASNHQPH